MNHSPRRCACCEKRRTRGERQVVRLRWEGRMDLYCEDCCWARCDAFPGECPNRDGAS